jgi:acetyltransferase-like isoleucine patch superfamily enzyme
MSAFYRGMEGVRQRLSIFAQKVRAELLRIRGARVAGKVRIGSRVLADRPWGIALGERVFIESDVYLKLVSDRAELRVGDHTFIGRGSELDVDESVTVGAHTLIAPGCFITDHHHEIAGHARIDQQACRTEPVVIGDDVWVGANCVILAGVTIGDGAVIGAGAVVTRNVAEMDIVAGVPARRIGSRKDH